jgi:XTP/dITP diphosphohydrolase
MALIFATSNRHKFEEVKAMATKHGVKLKMCDVQCDEIQADNLEDIAGFSAKEACRVLGKPCFVEDAGLFVRALRGFPGPYSNYVFRTIGNEGLLKLMAGVKSRRAEFRSAVSYCEPKAKPIVFSGSSDGSITTKARGHYGFGFDPIFAPKRSGGRTFAEMLTAEKNAFSHRAKAIENFIGWCFKNRVRFS